MQEKVKEQMLSSAEKMTETALTEMVKMAEVYAKSTEHTTVDDSVVAGIKTLKAAFLDGLVDKISDTDGD